MVRNFLLLFIALRAADLLNLAGGLWLVPKFVAPEDLGAVLPLTTFATLIAIPLYAIAMTALREAARLRADGKNPRTLIRGVFAAVGVAAILALVLAAALLPRAVARFRISDSLSGYLAIAAAFLGCVAPVYLDQLQAAKRFGAVGTIEIVAASVRLAVMAAIMPFRALAGYFAGAVVKPVVQIAGPLLALRRENPGGDAEGGYWTPDNRVRFFKTFVLLLTYLVFPMLASMMESDMVRTMLSSTDSAGYYMATRISDMMNYITFPLLFVMFPYVTENSVRGKSSATIVYRSVVVIFIIAIAAGLITMKWGTELLALMPNGGNYGAYAGLLPMLLAFMAFGAAQNIITNAEVAAGRFGFLWWFVPLHLAYIEALPRLMKGPSLDSLIAAFLAFASIRFLIAAIRFRRPISGSPC